jgi:hypothetical protein
MNLLIRTLFFLLVAGVSVAAPSLIRGPYLQSASPNSVVVRWRTDHAGTSMVKYGLAPDQLTWTARSHGVLTEHIVALSDLSPATRYYYQIGSAEPEAKPLAGGSSLAFTTPPVAGPSVPARIWVLGDPGTANSAQARVRDAALSFMGTRPPDSILLLGDNAYPDGTDAEYQRAIFDMYSGILRTTPVWPALGNHDARSAGSITQSGVYYDIFTLPTLGQAGGVSSGTEAYYSFDYANIHFICLDSQDTDRRPDGAMMQWLQADLAMTKRDWIIVFFHHPTYTKGTHDSDVEKDSGGRMKDMRVHFMPVLEAGGVDLVLTGHSHVYERSWFIDGHYDVSATFDSAVHIKQAGNGRADGDGAYRKKAGRVAHAGEVSVVAGSSGKTSEGPLNHPAMVVSLAELGSVVIDVDGPKLELAFINDAGVKRDWFTILKD